MAKLSATKSSPSKQAAAKAKVAPAAKASVAKNSVKTAAKAPAVKGQVKASAKKSSSGGITAKALADIPLFRGIPTSDLEALLDVFESTTSSVGDILFRAGETAGELLLLGSGEVTVYENEEPKFKVEPISVIGELGGLTGTPRNATARVTRPSQIHRAGVRALMQHFEANPKVAFPFYRNLLSLVAEKVRRDRERVGQMRSNIIRTQKAMKDLRDFVLESQETRVSKRVVDVLEEHIGKNRRAGYRVHPSPAFPAFVRVESGTTVPVVEISNGYLKLASKAKLVSKKGVWVGVLSLPSAEIAVSGSVEREAHDGVVVKLDDLIDDYRLALEDYVTRLQLLDFVL
jgi:CRP/FNR family transcriptional regulator, cyclic AMP receptor protein